MSTARTAETDLAELVEVLTTLRTEHSQHAARITGLLKAVDLAERGGATVMRLDVIRALLVARKPRRNAGRSRR